jgi:Mg2+ and Co2+ transporter CorA
MKLYTADQVKELLQVQRGNCYVAVLSATKDKEIASIASQAPLPRGDDFDRYYGIDVGSLLKEDLEDKEMQENYDRFKRSRESAKTSYNTCVPTLNSMINKIVNLKELIVSLAVQGLPTEKAVKRLAKLDDSFTKLSEKADQYKAEMDKQDTLIKNYKDWNERKLFMHWKYLTLLKVTDQPWLEFKKQYEDIII